MVRVRFTPPHVRPRRRGTCRLALPQFGAGLSAYNYRQLFISQNYCHGIVAYADKLYCGSVTVGLLYPW